MPEEIEILPVEIHLPGLLKVLGEHLYSDPRVAIRELIQNAHDSCVRRQQEDSNLTSTYEPRITVRVDTEAQQLLIEDNGSGLTHNEITVFLATVGRGYTRELRERLGNAQREEALDLIGMFGLGLLSAFMVATRIEITTASYQNSEEAWKWTSDGGQSYALRSSSRPSIGTTVRLDLRNDALFLLDTTVLRDTLNTYTIFLPIPIYIGRDTTPINDSPAPWMLDLEDGPGLLATYRSWIDERTSARPLSVLPLHSIQTDDGQTIPLNGVLYIPQRSIISIQEYGDVTVYVRHMLITERERDLLPDWARFVSGIIDCPALNPTASRETLRHDEMYHAIQLALEKVLFSHFEHLADHAPIDWQAIIRAHNDLIKGWSVRALDLFTRVADLVSFKTSRGELTIPQYLHENPGRIFYYDNEDGVTQALALFEARRLAVIDARWFADTAFLKAYGQIYGVPVEELTPAASYLFTSVEDREKLWQPLLDACRSEGFPTRLLAYEPEHLPIILLYPPGAERLRRAQHNMNEGKYVGPIRSLVRGYLERQQVDESVMKGVLHLNARNPLLRRIRDMGPQDPHFQPLVSILVSNARMFAGQNLSAQDAITCFEQINTSLAKITGITATLPHGHNALTPQMLTTIGLHPEAAGRLCAICETVESLLAADPQTLADQVHISSLLLITIREELKRQAEPITNPLIPPPQKNIISLVDARTQKNAEESHNATEE